jgi:Tol biopolymer transport system component
MKKFINISLVIYLSVLIFSCSEDKIDFTEFGQITGKVIKANSFELIENSKVTLSPSNNSTFTDADGYYEFLEVPEGEYSIKAEKDTFITGFEPTTVSIDQTVNVIIELENSDALNRPPTDLNLISPADNSVNIGIEVNLTWSDAVDPDDDEVFYNVEIRNDINSDVIVIEDLTDTSYHLTGLQFGAKYFWQIIATDTINPEVLSTIFTFETNAFPNNRYLFVREENGNNVIYSSNELGEDIAITSSVVNSWRPRKNQVTQRIAFLKTHNSETHLFTMNSNGTDEQQVTSIIPPAGFKQSEIDFSWSANGSRIMYSNFDKLYVINQDGSGNQLIYQTTDGNFITECDWSNDGSFVALKTNNNDGYNVKIYTIDLSGNVLTTVLSGVNGAAGGINISVNNQKLLYTYDLSAFEDFSYRQLNTHLFVYDFNTSISTDISINKPNGTNDLDPRFSPDESKIIMVNTSNDGLSEKKIVTVEINSYETREHLFNNAMMPDWE